MIVISSPLTLNDIPLPGIKSTSLDEVPSSNLILTAPLVISSAVKLYAARVAASHCKEDKLYTNKLSSGMDAGAGNVTSVRSFKLVTLLPLASTST